MPSAESSNPIATVAQQQAYRTALEQVCARAQVPQADWETVLASQMLMLGNVPFALKLEVWSSFIKVLVDVGKPLEEDAPRFHRYLLTQQLLQPAPFFLAAAVHAETDHVMLYGYSPMPTDDEAHESFFGFLQGCAFVCETLRGNADPQAPLEFPVGQMA